MSAGASAGDAGGLDDRALGGGEPADGVPGDDGSRARGPTGAVVAADAPDAVDRVVAALDHGGLVVLPTETVYGLAAAAADGHAVDRIFAAKGRDASVPVAVLCADVGQALSCTTPDAAAAVADLVGRHWPGPLTVVVPRRADLGWRLGEPSTTIGLRCPDHDLVRAVAARVGPIATTSANRHGRPTPPTALGAAADLLEPVALVVDGGEVTGTPSTVLDATSSPWRVLRQGAVEVPGAG